MQWFQTVSTVKKESHFQSYLMTMIVDVPGSLVHMTDFDLKPKEVQVEMVVHPNLTMVYHIPRNVQHTRG